MAGKKSTKAPATAGALSPEEFQKLTPEEQLAKLNEAQAKATAAEAKAKAAELKVDKNVLPVLEGVEADEDNEIEAGDYQWTAPTFTWDDNRVIKVKELMAEAAATDKKVAEKAETIIAHLLQRHSGLLVRIQETED